MSQKRPSSLITPGVSEGYHNLLLETAAALASGLDRADNSSCAFCESGNLPCLCFCIFKMDAVTIALFTLRADVKMNHETTHTKESCKPYNDLYQVTCFSTKIPDIKMGEEIGSSRSESMQVGRYLFRKGVCGCGCVECELAVKRPNQRTLSYGEKTWEPEQ